MNKKLYSLIGNDSATMLLKLQLLSKLEDSSLIKDMCKLDKLWDNDTLGLIMDDVISEGSETENLLFNIRHYLLPLGSSRVNMKVAGICLERSYIELLPYLMVNIPLKWAIAKKSLDKDYLYTYRALIDIYLNSNVELIPRWVFGTMFMVSIKHNTDSNNIVQAIMEFKIGQYRDTPIRQLYLNYVSLMVKEIIGDHSKKDKLYLSALSAVNGESLNDKIYSNMDYWADGGTIIPGTVSSIEYIYYLKCSIDRDYIDIRPITAGDNNVELLSNVFIRDLLYTRQVRNPSLVVRLNDIPKVRIESICDYIDKINRIPADVQMFKNCNIRPLEIFTGVGNLKLSHIEVYLTRGGSWSNLSSRYKRLMGYDSMLELCTDAKNIQEYLVSRFCTHEERASALKYSNPVDFATEEPNRYGVSGSELFLESMKLTEFFSAFPTKESYMDAVIKNPLIMKYYKLPILSIVDYNSLIQINSEISKYVDTNIYTDDDLIRFVAQGLMDISNPMIMDRPHILLNIINIGIDLVDSIPTLIWLYDSNPILVEIYFKKILNTQGNP